MIVNCFNIFFKQEIPSILILSTLSLLYIISKVCTVTMLVVVDLQTVFHTDFIELLLYIPVYYMNYLSPYWNVNVYRMQTQVTVNFEHRMSCYLKLKQGVNRAKVYSIVKGLFL